MKFISLKKGMVCLAVSALVPLAHAQAQESGRWGRLSLSYRAALNVSAKFSGLGGFAGGASPGGPGSIAAAPGTVVRTYDDGFIGVDVTGNAGNLTWFFGFANDSQVIADTLQLHATTSTPTSQSRESADPQHGVELSYALPLGGGKRWKWGVEGALNWTDINVKDNKAFASTITTLTHAFALSGVILPPAPYSGTSLGPGPIISDVAVDVSGPSIAGPAITGNRAIEGAVGGLRLGPLVEFTVCKHCSLELGAGLSVGVANTTFSFTETAAAPVGTATGRIRNSEVLCGGYLRGQVNVHVWKALSWMAAAEFNHLGTHDQQIGARRSELDLGKTVYVSTGFSISF